MERKGHQIDRPKTESVDGYVIHRSNSYWGGGTLLLKWDRMKLNRKSGMNNQPMNTLETKNLPTSVAESVKESTSSFPGLDTSKIFLGTSISTWRCAVDSLNRNPQLRHRYLWITPNLVFRRPSFQVREQPHSGHIGAGAAGLEHPTSHRLNRFAEYAFLPVEDQPLPCLPSTNPLSLRSPYSVS